MKLREHKIDYPYFNKKTGTILPGKYIVNGIIKVAELKRLPNKQIVPLYLPTYRKGQTLTIKSKKDTMDFRVVFYGELFNDENYYLMKKFFKSNPNKSEFLEFVPTHYKELIEAFKGNDNLNPYLLQLMFDFNRLPNEFEMTYKGWVINDIVSIKQLWENKENKKSFELLTYIK